MSIQQPETLVDPNAAFWASDPTVLKQPDSFADSQENPRNKPDLAKIAVVLAAAVVTVGYLVKHHMDQEQPPPRTQEEIRKSSAKIWSKVFPAWMRIAVPAITEAYAIGSTGNLTYAELEVLATDYAKELGDYVHQTSVSAIMEGFVAQVNAGWNDAIAWDRAKSAYGLDPQQMKSYLTSLMAQDKGKYITDPIPTASKAIIQQGVLNRADRLGANEAFKASQVGKNVVWMTMAANGDLPAGTRKQWNTAEDERVCAVCGPLDGRVIPLHWKFSTETGEKFYAPGVHPNCRCELSLVYPEFDDIVKNMPGDPYDRDHDGQFSSKESRNARATQRLVEVQAESKPDPVAMLSRRRAAMPSAPTTAIDALQEKSQALSSLIDPASELATDPIAALRAQLGNPLDELRARQLDSQLEQVKVGQTKKVVKIITYRDAKGALQTQAKPMVVADVEAPIQGAPAFYPGSTFFKRHRMDESHFQSDACLGEIIDIGTRKDADGNTVTDVIKLIRADDPTVESQEFAEAFDLNERKQKPKAAAGATSSPTMFSEDISPNTPKRYVLAVSGRSKEDLRSIVLGVLNENKYADVYFDSPNYEVNDAVMNRQDYGAIDDLDASQLAATILNSSSHERDDAVRGDAISTQWSQAINREAASTKDFGDKIPEDDTSQGLRAEYVTGEGGSADEEIPTVFRFDGWRGTDDADGAMAEGRYRIVESEEYESMALGDIGSPRKVWVITLEPVNA
jgi:hypothetical protein